MDSAILFTAALGLQSPWRISSVEFRANRDSSIDQELHLTISHEAGAKFEVDGHHYPVYDHQDREWRHLNFFEHTCYLRARVPRVRLKSGETRLIEVPWAQPGSSFTLLFEAYAMLLVDEGMSLKSAGRYVNEDGRIIGRIIRREVAQALASQQLAQVEHLGLDETSSRKGHNYLTILTDVGRKKVVGIAEGKDKDAVDNALFDMEVRGSNAKEVKVVTLDMSPSYISAAEAALPNAEFVFDRFHIEALLSKAVDEVRREDQKQNVELRKTRYLWLRNEKDLTDEKRSRVHYLAEAFPRIGKAHRLKEQFKEIWATIDYDEAIENMMSWIKEAQQAKLAPISKFIQTLHKHWYGIERYFVHRKTNAFAERVNLKIQEIKRSAKGYRNISNYISMIYFHLGGLDLPLPTKNS